MPCPKVKSHELASCAVNTAVERAPKRAVNCTSGHHRYLGDCRAGPNRARLRSPHDNCSS